MKKLYFLMITSLLIISLGILFFFQSRSYIGPPESFMYSNTEWSLNGLILIIIGISILIVGIIVFLKKRS